MSNKRRYSLYLDEELVSQVEEAYVGLSRNEAIAKTLKDAWDDEAQGSSGDEGDDTEMKEALNDLEERIMKVLIQTEENKEELTDIKQRMR